ncbi:MAG: ketoacyl-ACP synthase III [Actinobacteria bacterium]|nr:ketoacyl-ACP synthase III [Actinomycetota bacterium]
MSVIRGIGTYLPEKTVGNDELIERFDWDREFLEVKLGIHQRHIAAEGEGASDMGVAAAEDLFAKCPDFKREDVQLLIVCTQNPDYGLPHTSALVQDRLSLPTTTACFDVGLGCSGFVYGLSIVHSMLETLNLTNALIVTSDPYSKVIDPADRGTSPLFGDGAAATWISRTGAGGQIGTFTFGTDGAGARNLIVEPDADGVRCLSMNGRAIFEFMLERIPGDLERCAESNGLTTDEIDLFSLHQASAHMLGYVTKRMKLDPARVPIHMQDTGNLVSSSIPFLIARLAGQGDLAGKTTLLSGFGVGLSWASTVVRFDANPIA